MIKYLSSFFAITFFFVSFACASDVEKHKREAKDLCEVYNPDNWVEFFKNNSNPSIDEIYREIGKRISAVVLTDEFRAIYQEIFDEYKPDVYGFTKDRVSRLIGKEWECEHYDHFYFPHKEIVLNIDEVGKVINPLVKRNEIKITIDKDGNLYVNSGNPIKSDKQSIKASISSQSDANKANIVIFADANAPNQAFVTIVSTLNELGFGKIRIATQ